MPCGNGVYLIEGASGSKNHSQWPAANAISQASFTPLAIEPTQSKQSKRKHAASSSSQSKLRASERTDSSYLQSGRKKKWSPSQTPSPLLKHQQGYLLVGVHLLSLRQVPA